MDEKDLAIWCKGANLPVINIGVPIPTRLDGYQLSFNYFSKRRGSGAANIMKSAGDVVYGLLIDLDPIDLRAIRIKEGYRIAYNEIQVDVEKFNGEIVHRVLTYQVLKSRELPIHQPPSQYYIGLILRNARRYGFPKHYIDYLGSIKTKDITPCDTAVRS